MIRFLCGPYHTKEESVGLSLCTVSVAKQKLNKHVPAATKKIVISIILYTVCVISKERRHLVLP
jgi:hypothetical protein